MYMKNAVFLAAKNKIYIYIYMKRIGDDEKHRAFSQRRLVKSV